MSALTALEVMTARPRYDRAEQSMDLALFDFDGTITTIETFPVFMRRAVPAARAVVGGGVLAPLLVGYKAGLVSGKTVRAAMVGVGLRGVPEDRVRDVAHRFALEFLPQVVRPTAIERIQWHKARGDVVVIVSAALDLYLEEWACPFGLDVVCSRLEARNGLLTGRYHGRDCCGPQKTARILAQYDLERFAEIYAYGDTIEDEDMLSLASKRYFRWQERTA
jgi:phosphatidylglycerophosphatase C